MSCAGSLGPTTSYGSPMQAYACPAGNALVGVDLAYTPPSSPSPASAGARRCKKDADCHSDELCSSSGACAPPAGGAVYRLSALYCAPANDIAARARHPLGDAPSAPVPPNGATPATFVCPAGQALTGANIWVDGLGGQIQQIQLRCNTFAAGAPPAAPSGKYPTARAPKGSRALTLSTLGAPPSALFANGIAQSYEPDGGKLTALGFNCQDYADEFDTSAARQVACCTGTAQDPQFCRGLAPQTEGCDAYMAQYCADDCAAGKCAHPACGCLGSPVALPECHDARCADTAEAYRTAQMRARQGGSCPKTVPCGSWDLLGDGKYLSKAVTPPDCTTTTSRAPAVTAAIILFIFLVFIAGALRRAPKKPAAAPPPPPDLFL
jgi:hypothetical protein